MWVTLAPAGLLRNAVSSYTFPSDLLGQTRGSSLLEKNVSSVGFFTNQWSTRLFHLYLVLPLLRSELWVCWALGVYLFLLPFVPLPFLELLSLRLKKLLKPSIQYWYLSLGMEKRKLRKFFLVVMNAACISIRASGARISETAVSMCGSDWCFRTLHASSSELSSAEKGFDGKKLACSISDFPAQIWKLAGVKRRFPRERIDEKMKRTVTRMTEQTQWM
ncbi:hypothetical protein BGZ57DRAFT_856464 [Hyaloscypha finlandica]|nr:hypothetical protein BGZ57DRAFT_856464 [Hyaloscypha finlandica]